MRYFAVTLLLAAMGAAGYLAWTGLHQTPEVIPSGEVKTVRVDNFAYASPELVKPENLKVEAPAVRDEAVQAAEAAVEEAAPVQAAEAAVEEAAPVLEPVDEAKLEGLTCVVFGPLQEKRLPKHRRFFEKVDLIRKMNIVPYSDTRYAVYAGPFTQQKARKNRKALCGDDLESCSIMELKAGGHAVVLKTFSDEKAAELWSKKFALDNGLTNVRVTRYNHVAGSRVVLVFNGIADQQVKALLKRSKAEGIGLSVCPKGL